MPTWCWLAKSLSLSVDSPWPGESSKFHPQHSSSLASLVPVPGNCISNLYVEPSESKLWLTLSWSCLCLLASLQSMSWWGQYHCCLDWRYAIICSKGADSQPNGEKVILWIRKSRVELLTLITISNLLLKKFLLNSAQHSLRGCSTLKPLAARTCSQARRPCPLPRPSRACWGVNALQDPLLSPPVQDPAGRHWPRHPGLGYVHVL